MSFTFDRNEFFAALFLQFAPIGSRKTLIRNHQGGFTLGRGRSGKTTPSLFRRRRNPGSQGQCRAFTDNRHFFRCVDLDRQGRFICEL